MHVEISQEEHSYQKETPQRVSHKHCLKYHHLLFSNGYTNVFSTLRNGTLYIVSDLYKDHGIGSHVIKREEVDFILPSKQVDISNSE